MGDSDSESDSQFSVTADSVQDGNMNITMEDGIEMTKDVFNQGEAVEISSHNESDNEASNRNQHCPGKTEGGDVQAPKDEGSCGQEGQPHELLEGALSLPCNFHLSREGLQHGRPHSSALQVHHHD